MGGQIEKMSRMRKNILWGVLMGTIVAFCLDLSPTIFSIFSFNRRFLRTLSNSLFYCAIILWFLSIFIFLTRFWLYKKKLKKDPSLPTAVYDERAKLNWLKAYRVAFFVTVGFTILRMSPEFFFFRSVLSVFSRFNLPNGPFFVLWGAIIALVGSFLYYNRGAKNE